MAALIPPRGASARPACAVGAKAFASTNSSPTRCSPASYFEKVAADIVATSPVFGKARVPVVASHRDKESLVCEIIDLKKALEDTETHLRMHKYHYLRALEESRRLEREVEELELRGNLSAPRTGGVVRLESRFKGLGAQVNLLEKVVVERKYGELAQLRRDIGATNTRETEIERDTVAGEISRLKVYLRRMKALNREAETENKNLNFCKRQLARLEVANPRIARTVEGHKAINQNLRDEIERLKQQGEVDVGRMNELGKQNKKFDKKIHELEPKAHAAEIERQKIVREENQLGYDRMVFNQEFKKEHPDILLG